MPGHQSACLLPLARPLTTQQKISGRLASDDTTQDRPEIRRYIDTARKHGKNAMDILHELMPGRPWRPPEQAFSLDGADLLDADLTYADLDGADLDGAILTGIKGLRTK